PLPLAVCVPAPVTGLPGAASGACFAGPHSPWSPPLAPPAPLRLAPPQIAPQGAVPLCSPASQLLWRGPTSRLPASPATAPPLPHAGPPPRRAPPVRPPTPPVPLRSPFPLFRPLPPHHPP